MKTLRPVLHTVGSLWLAAVLLVLLLFAMACATAYESAYSTEGALAEFYGAWWFEGLLWLFALNNLAALILRWPFSKRYIGFVMTHGSILIILGGALVTKHFAINGQVGLREGQTTRVMTDRHQESVTVVSLRTQARATRHLDPNIFGGLRVAENPVVRPLQLGEMQVDVQRYLPDSRWSRSVEPTQEATLPPAVEATLIAGDNAQTAWIVPEEPQTLGDLRVALRVATDPAELASLLDTQAAAAATQNTVRIAVDGQTFDIPLDRAMNESVPLGDTDYAIRVLRYLTNANVAAGGRITNDPSRPRNPVIEVEITGPSVRETRYAFAKFPGFRHGGATLENIEVTFLSESAEGPVAPIELIHGPDGALYVRFSTDDTPVAARPVQVNERLETPWPERSLLIRRHLAHARDNWTLEPRLPPRVEEREPAILLSVTTGGRTQQRWLPKGRSVRFSDGQTPHEILYMNRQRPLGFALTLDKFHLGHYPGGRAPRTFESLVTLNDPTGRERHAVVTMNAPTTHGGYQFFQSSYNIAGDQRWSFLNVSRDPGRPIVYVGYVVLLAGMVVVFLTRMIEHRTKAASRAKPVQA